MPTQSTMKAALQAYIDGFNTDDANAIMALFADNAVIEDPVGSPLKSRAEFEAFIRQGVAFGARLSLAAPIRGSHGNAAAMAFIVTFVQDGRRIISNSVDVMTFDESGKITRMNGYWGPDDVTGA
ncbi:MAG: steroid delta-isomerase [Rhodospirillales bacterium]|nr:steroid delta-isomerase [Rhodospirillales bacterium]